MKKSFETPEIDLVYLGTDVICTSGPKFSTSSNTEVPMAFINLEMKNQDMTLRIIPFMQADAA